MDPLALSRMQFGETAAFHILWPLMSIGLALYMVVMEGLWLYTNRESYYRQLRFWTRIFVLTFAIGTASGLPLAFQFGTNWSQFAQYAGDFLGNILGFETTIAFALESAFLAILIFGWHKVPKWLHFFSTLMVFVGASISAFWIMAANSWMQTPAGVAEENGHLIVTDYAQAILNPDTLISFAHMMVACIEATLFMIAGIAAWKLLSSDAPHIRAFFRNTLLYCIGIAIVVTPLQVVLGDLSGQTIARYQPEKLAASELWWDTNPPQTGADWNIIAWPNAAHNGNIFALPIPNGLSMLITHSANGQVRGLNDFPAEDRPSALDATVIFYCLRIMVAIGICFCLLMLWSLWYWTRGELALSRIGAHRAFLRCWVFAIPLGYIATETGWAVREMGRQPWTIYHVLRTTESASYGLTGYEVAATAALIALAYLFFIAMFIYFTYRIVKSGPDLASPLP